MLAKALRLTPILVIMFFAWLMLRLTLPYLSFRPDVDFLRLKQAVYHIHVWRQAFYIHIFTSIFILVFGAVQFIRPLIRKYPQWHRLAGKLYLVLVLFLSGPAAVVMAWYANGGKYAQASFLILSALWLYFTFMAYYYVRRRKYARHSDFMLRSYALTLSAITFRLYALLMPYTFHLHGKEEYIFLAWASWIPNLLVAELLIRAGYMHKLKPKGLLS